MLNWSSISMWLTSCHNPQEGPWAPWSNIHYPSSTMAALGCPSQMKPSASSICTHFVHYSWAKNNPSLHLTPHAPQLLTHLFLSFLLSMCLFIDMFACLCTSFCPYYVVANLKSKQPSSFWYMCVVIHRADSLSGPTVWVRVCVV